MAIALGAIGAVVFIASAILSGVFVFRHPKKRWRALPCIVIIALPIIEFVPASGWSDVRSQWSRPVLTMLWSILALGLGIFFLGSGQGTLGNTLRVLFSVMGMIVLAESWQFFHGI